MVSKKQILAIASSFQFSYYNGTGLKKDPKLPTDQPPRNNGPNDSMKQLDDRICNQASHEKEQRAKETIHNLKVVSSGSSDF